ncbi:MAG: L-threonylcarbamoyladenylate synthase [Roseburia sp.]|nr:L-threonylcarbamoyladenylate synthase [Roseburia sp.]
METKVYKIDRNVIDMVKIKEAADILQTGGLVAFPTETVYGLGADAMNPQASRNIYAAKGRPSDNPLIIHIAKWEDLEFIASGIPEKARKLSQAFWPGPLTMIFNKKEEVPKETTGGLDTVAVRMPKDEIALKLIDKSGCLIAAPSANTSGRPSPTLADHVFEDLNGRIPLILDGGEVGIGIESTILDLTEEVPVILRPGCITKEMLEQVIGEVRIDPGLLAEDSKVKPKAPGMKYRHYAPKANLVLVGGQQENVIAKINALTEDLRKQEKKVGIIGTDETVSRYVGDAVISIGAREDEESIARHLYRILREFDELGVEMIYSESFSSQGIGQAIMNRLLKAAAHQVIEV